MMTSELNEAIDAIEKVAESKHTVKLSPHRWGQVLRVLKLYRLRENVLIHDPAWDWRHNHPASPYYIKGWSDLPEQRDRMAKYYKKHPELAIEPPEV